MLLAAGQDMRNRIKALLQLRRRAEIKVCRASLNTCDFGVCCEGADWPALLTRSVVRLTLLYIQSALLFVVQRRLACRSRGLQLFEVDAPANILCADSDLYIAESLGGNCDGSVFRCFWQCRNEIRNRNQRHETGESNGDQPAGRNRNQRTPLTEPCRHVTETGAITQGFFCIEDIAIVITSSSKHVFLQTDAMPPGKALPITSAGFSQVFGAYTCSPAHRRDRHQSFAGLVGAAILTPVPNARFRPGLLTSHDHCVWE